MDYFNVVMGYIPIGMLRFEPSKVVKDYKPIGTSSFYKSICTKVRSLWAVLPYWATFYSSNSSNKSSQNIERHFGYFENHLL